MKKFACTMTVLFAATPMAFAAANHSATVTIPTTVHVGVNTLQAGEYDLKWADGGGQLVISGVRVKISLPITATSGEAGPTTVLTRRDGDVTLLEGFRIKNTVLTITTSSDSK